jgi:flagellar biogenesis protein FliO
MTAMMMLLGAMTTVVFLGWFVERFQRDIDAYHQRDYREPPVFASPPVG